MAARETSSKPAAPTPVGYSIQLGQNPSGTGTYTLSGSGYIFVTNEVVGESGSGTFTQTGGTNSTYQLNVADTSSAHGCLHPQQHGTVVRRSMRRSASPVPAPSPSPAEPTPSPVFSTSATTPAATRPTASTTASYRRRARSTTLPRRRIRGLLRHRNINAVGRDQRHR